MKQVEFDIELVKKIQNGEINGSILTRDGRPARFLGEIKDPVYPLVFAREIKHNKGRELSDVYTLTGRYSVVRDEHDSDIIIEIEEEIEEEKQKSEYQFKPFDKVLVRDSDTDVWVPALYQFYSERGSGERHHFANDIFYIQCIPYEGNEHLVGTTNK